MNKIIRKKRLSENVFRMDVEAPLIASERKPGQFIILSVDDNYAERIPLTIADAKPSEGIITLIFQVVGATTKKLARLEEGDMIDNILGPLGKPTHIEYFGTVVCVGGGIGIAPMYPIAQGMKAAGNKLICILGARSKELLIMEDEMREISDQIIICTDDGSYGKKALVTEPLKEICANTPPPDLAVAIGPPVMMKFCAQTTRPFNVKTLVSLNTIMIDGTGMCGGCRVTVGGKTKFVCVDGPEFDGHQVDFDNMMKRLNAFKTIERRKFEEECKLDAEIKKLENKNG